jgi:MoaA/NifB/PqqE/SkfB family radical SAM enzyme
MAVISHYTWAYASARVAKRYFKEKSTVLITNNMKEIAKKHDFGMEVIELDNFGFKHLFASIKQLRGLKRIGFDSALVDHGFNLNTLTLLLCIGFKKIYLVDFSSREITRLIDRAEFLRLFAAKMPYFINKVLIYLSKKMRLSVSLGKPSELSIETTTVCNLRCRGCPTGLGNLNRPAEFIKRDIFDAIIKDNSGNFRYLDIVYPFIFGEPLLNKDIFSYVRSIRRASAPYTRIELHTNGNIKASKDTLRQLLESGVDLINISIDGTNPEAYESFRKNGDFNLVCEFARNVVAARNEMSLARPEILIQMIVTKYSENQIEEAKKLKDAIGADRILFKGYFHEFTGLSDEEGYSIAPLKEELAFNASKKLESIRRKNNMCGWLYRSMSILCNGDISPCCIDFNASLLGGLNIEGLIMDRLWNSRPYRRLRHDMLRGKIEMCSKCFFT